MPDEGCPGADHCDWDGTYIRLTTTTISSTSNDCPTPAYVTSTISATAATRVSTGGNIISPTLTVRPCHNDVLYNLLTACSDSYSGDACVACPVVGNNSPGWMCRHC